MQEQIKFNCFQAGVPLIAHILHDTETGGNIIKAVYLTEYYRNPSILNLLSEKTIARILAKFAERNNK